MNKFKVQSTKFQIKGWGENLFGGGRWKVFVLSLVAQLLISSLLHLGLKAPAVLDFLSVSNIQARTFSVVSPLPVKNNTWQEIKVKLEQKINHFQLQKGAGMIHQTEETENYSSANSYAVVNLNTGEVLAAKDLDKVVPVASLTKLMTAVAVLDLASPDETFTVSAKAAGTQPTKIGVVAGQKMQLKELLPAMLLTSANDATEVVREGIDAKYGDHVFIKAMNEKAVFLGLKNTHFANPQGLDHPENYSSAGDLAILTQYTLTNYPQIAEITGKDYQFLPEDQNHKQFDLYNWNGLLGVYPGVGGVKIGNTGDAGYTTIVVSKRDGVELVVVLLGAPGVLQRDLWAAQLLDLGFDKLGISPANISEKQLKAKYSTWKYWG